MSVHSTLDLVIGLLEMFAGLAVLRQLWRFRSGFPWLIALTAFFVVRGVDRTAVAFTGDAREVFSFALDGVLIGILVVLLVTVERLVGSLEAAEDAARFREAEYSRAVADYRRLVRHRLATPLTAILGSIRILREPTCTTQYRSELLEILEQGALRLEAVCLDPTDVLKPDESYLRPQPDVQDARNRDASGSTDA